MSDKSPLTGDYRTDAGPIAAYLAELHDQLGGLRQDFENARGKVEFDCRLAALRAAHEHVVNLPGEKANERGYRDCGLKGKDLISEELRVAAFLLGRRED